MPIKLNKYQLSPLRIAAIYALIGGLWILFSDTLLAVFVTDKGVITRISIYKGWFLVIVTAGLLYWLIRRFAETQGSAAGKIERLSRLCRVIVRTSEAILRMKDQHSLFSEACRLAVEEGGLRMAWIGLVDEKDKFVRPVASSGVVDGYLDHIRISIDPGIPEGQGPTGTAIRAGRNFICKDIENDPHMVLWREQALKRGYRSSAAFPLKSEKLILGSINLYAPEAAFFDDEEIMLIETLAANISLAIVVIRQGEESLKAEQALRESEDKFRQVFESANVGKSITSPTGEISVNKAFAELLGHTQDELRNMTWQALTPPEDIEAVQIILAALLKGEKDSARFEKRYIHKNGLYLWADVSVAVRRDQDDKPLYFITTIVDITARKQAEEAIRNSEFLLQETQRISKVGGWEYDVGNKRLSWTDEVYRIYGVSPDEHDPNNFGQDIGYYEDRAAIETAFGRAVEFGEPYDLELKFRNAGGQSLWVRTIGRAEQKDGKTVRVFGNILDISERKRAEAAIIRSEQVLRLFVEHSPASIAMFDREMKYIVASRRYLIDYDIGEQNVIGHSHYEIFPEIPERWKEIHKRCQAGETLSADGDLFPRASGKSDWVTWEIRPWYELHGEIGGIILFSEVITERKQTELELKKHRGHLEELIENRTAELHSSQLALLNIVEDLNLKTEELGTANVKLKEVDRLKSLFIASMSHELRTPLNSIIGFTGILLQGLAGELNQEQRKQLGMVKGSSEHLLSLITDIIDLSKIEAGKIDLSIESFDLAGLVREVLGSFQVLAERKSLSLSAEIPPGLMLVSDKRRIRQVLVNLIGNSVKFTDQGGVSVMAQEKDGFVEVAVRDTGMGIKPEDLGKLFKSFSQVTTAEAPKHEGTGLGLYLSKRLVILLGGEIGVESEFGKGSVFFFTLPMETIGGGDEKGFGS